MSEVFEAHLQNMVFNEALLLESLFDNETDLLLACNLILLQGKW